MYWTIYLYKLDLRFMAVLIKILVQFIKEVIKP